MEMHAVDSSNVEAVGYDEATKTLGVQFKYKSLLYHYANVPRSVYNELLAAESVGKYLNKAVKGTYDYKTVEIKEG